MFELLFSNKKCFCVVFFHNDELYQDFHFPNACLKSYQGRWMGNSTSRFKGLKVCSVNCLTQIINISSNKYGGVDHFSFYNDSTKSVMLSTVWIASWLTWNLICLFLYPLYSLSFSLSVAMIFEYCDLLGHSSLTMCVCTYCKMSLENKKVMILNHAFS